MEVMKQVRAALTKIEEWDGVASVLPTMINRMETLQGLHSEAANFRFVSYWQHRCHPFFSRFIHMFGSCDACFSQSTPCKSGGGAGIGVTAVG